MYQAVTHNSLVNEAKKCTHNSPKYYYLRRAPKYCCTTTGEYFGKGSIVTDVEIVHGIKDGARSFREKEMASNNQIIKSMSARTEQIQDQTLDSYAETGTSLFT